MDRLKTVIDSAVLCAVVVAAMVFFAVSPVRAEDPVDPGGERVPVDPLDLEESPASGVDETQAKWSEVIVSTASWMDAFFDDDAYRHSSNKTYLRIKVSPTYYDTDGFKLNNTFDLRLQLPNTERWLFTMGGDPDEETGSNSTSLEDEEKDASGENDQNIYVGVSTFFKQSRTRNISTGAGVKWRLGGSAVYGTFRWVELWEFDSWDLRATQRLRLYSDDGLQFKTKLSADHPLSHQWLFRSSASALFKRDDPTNFYDLDLSLYHFITTRKALHFSLKNGYKSTPDRSMYLNRIIGEVEYRQQWKDWFYTSLVPFARFDDANDWEPNPGIRLDFDFRIGHVGKSEFKSAFDRKQEANKARISEQKERSMQEADEALEQWKREFPDYGKHK